MEIDEKSLWNQKYSEGSHTSLSPDPLLVSAHQEFLSAQPAGNALDVAGGVGRHALWLAQRGWQVKLMDISEVGVRRAEENAKAAGMAASISTEVRDLNAMPDLGCKQYDLVLVFFFLQRSLFPALIATLKPGGVLLYKTYTTEQRRFSGGPSHPTFLLQTNELLHAFSPLRILHYHESGQGKGVAGLIAKKS